MYAPANNTRTIAATGNTLRTFPHRLNNPPPCQAISQALIAGSQHKSTITIYREDHLFTYRVEHNNQSAPPKNFPLHETNAETRPLTHLELQYRFGDKALKFQVVCPRNGTGVLKGLTHLELQYRFGGLGTKHSKFQVVCPQSGTAVLKGLNSYAQSGT